MRVMAMICLMATTLSLHPPSQASETVASAPQSQLELVDLTDEFAAYADISVRQSIEDRVNAFKLIFQHILPGFYTADEQMDAQTGRALENWAEHRAGVVEVSDRFAAMFVPALTSFEAALGPVTEPQSIYLVHSLGRMDGGIRPTGEGFRLVFGADQIAQIHLGHDIQPFFHHELFHIFHAVKAFECRSIGCALWTEGLATYAAATLNPDATDAELLLTRPRPIRVETDAHFEEAVCTIRERLDSGNIEDYRAMFGSSEFNDRLPPRFGYYIGMRVAEELAQQRSLRELAQLSFEDALPLMETAMQRMGACQT